MSKPDPNRHTPQEIDEYLAAQAPEFRATLKAVASHHQVGSARLH